MLFRYAVWMGEEGTGWADLSGYQDSHLVEPYAQEAMKWAVDTGCSRVGQTAVWTRADTLPGRSLR